VQLYRGSGTDLEHRLTGGSLISELLERFTFQHGYRPSPSELRSWERSLPYVARLLRTADLDDVQVLVEYQLPLASKRLDVVLVGTHPAGGVSAVIVENKQWTAGEIEDVAERVVVVGGRQLLHPQQQVANYAQYLRDFNQLAADDTLKVSGLAYLHNATAAQLAGLRSAALADVAQFPLFSGDEDGALVAFVRSRLAAAGAAAACDAFLQAPTLASKRLLDHVHAQIEGQPVFTLLDEQQVAYDLVLQAVAESRRSNTKKVVIVTGGPGTGKSVIAVDLVAALAKQGRNVCHATGSKAFTTTLRKLVGPRAGQLFRYWNMFGDAEPNELDAVIADEAHRLRAVSSNRFTPKHKISGLPQVDEILQVARVPVFLLDEHQVVRPEEIGTVAAIRQAAARNRAEVIQVDLNGQFRCAGSAEYISWVDALLCLDGDRPRPWPPEDPFDLNVVDTPEALQAWVQARAHSGHTARLSAGFCWPWSDPRPDGTLVEDVHIGSWRLPWNAKPGKKTRDAPSASLWATNPRGIDQVGCIYTAQGFEYDYGGVILGADLVWRTDHWEADSTQSRDPIVKRAENFPELAKHTYKVLLTRGLLGCAVYSVDRETREFLHDLLEELAHSTRRFS
jgi:DUF2075 family protein